jgi:hypothetical protein
MLQGSKRKWLGRCGLVALFVLVALVTWSWKNATLLKARYTAHQLHFATTDQDRAAAADRLLTLGPSGLTQIAGFIQSGDQACRDAAVAAVDRKLKDLPEGDPSAIPITSQILDAFPQSDDAGKRAILGLVSLFLKHTGNTFAPKCREAIAGGMKMADPEARLLSVRLALYPDLKMQSELIELLTDREPMVRGAALFGAATVAEGETVIADEALFGWLHDPDPEVRKVCCDALVARGRTDAEISLARKFSSPEPSERLKLIYDLRYDDDVSDPEPWLERLGRDREPSIRAGAARVILEMAAERKQKWPAWVSRMMVADPDATVRRIAMSFRQESNPIDGETRTISGP